MMLNVLFTLSDERLLLPSSKHDHHLLKKTAEMLGAIGEAGMYLDHNTVLILYNSSVLPHTVTIVTCFHDNLQ